MEQTSVMQYGSEVEEMVVVIEDENKNSSDQEPRAEARIGNSLFTHGSKATVLTDKTKQDRKVTLSLEGDFIVMKKGVESFTLNIGGKHPVAKPEILRMTVIRGDTVWLHGLSETVLTDRTNPHRWIGVSIKGKYLCLKKGACERLYSLDGEEIQFVKVKQCPNGHNGC